jgi:hypothetical protein
MLIHYSVVDERLMNCQERFKEQKRIKKIAKTAWLRT